MASNEDALRLGRQINEEKRKTETPEARCKAINWAIARMFILKLVLHRLAGCRECHRHIRCTAMTPATEESMSHFK